jgi:RNA 3'-terminal phosphate cyclase (ATP)
MIPSHLVDLHISNSTISAQILYLLLDFVMSLVSTSGVTGSDAPAVKLIDGSRGEGGGQVLRTSMSLAAILGCPIHIVNIRAGRPKPGLARQHLVSVSSAAQLAGGTLTGAEIGSTELTFYPGDILKGTAAGTYSFDIGSAGSASLVLQTILPILLWRGRGRPAPSTAASASAYAPSSCAGAGAAAAAPGPVTVTIRGGTHNPLAPPYDHLTVSTSYVVCGIITT